MTVSLTSYATNLDLRLTCRVPTIWLGREGIDGLILQLAWHDDDLVSEKGRRILDAGIWR
jgi:hypothetical protein